MLENIQAEGLLLRFKEEMAKWETRKKLFEDEKLEIYKIKGMAKELCTHPQTKEEDDYDYHRREDWTKVICLVCEKEVRRY